jgi:lipopolysaccharide exporter
MLARYVLQLAAQVVLARLLGPANYGLFALALLVLMFTTFLADFGFCWGLVQAKELCRDEIRFAVTWQLLSATAMSGLLYILAPWVATYFTEPGLEPILRWLSLSCVLAAAASPALNLLTRKLDFRTLNIIQVASYAIGYLGFGIPLAYSGYGVWALVVAWTVQSACTLVFAVIKNPYPFKPLFWCQGGTAISRVGATVFVTNICNWMLNNFDRVSLGRFLDAHGVGVYVAAYNLANTPNALLIGTLQPAFLAAGARVQEQPERLRRAYLSVVGVVWILVTPLFVVLAIVARDFVRLLYGPSWDTTGAVLSILALGMPAYITWGLSTPILWNTGKKQWETLLQLPVLLLAGLVLFYLARRGVETVALVTVSVLCARAVVVTTGACMCLGIGVNDLRGSIWRGGVMATIAAVGTWIGQKVGAVINDGYLMSLFAGGLAGVLTLMVAMFASPKLVGPAVDDMLMRFGAAFPRLEMMRAMMRARARQV